MLARVFSSNHQLRALSDVGPIMLTDYYHKDYFSIVEAVESTDINSVVRLSCLEHTFFPPLTSIKIQFSDNNLIQGRNNFNCSIAAAAGDTTPCVSDAGIASFNFTAGKTHRLRLINAGAEGIQKFSIDGHNMTVIANDFVPIQPYDTQVVTLAVGQRTDVIIQAPSRPLPAYTMRSSLSCSLSTQGDATAIVNYGTFDESKGAPNTTAWPSFLDSVANICVSDDLSLTVPYYPITPDPNPPTTDTIEIGFGQNSTGYWVWTMNNSSFRANYNHPILLLSNVGNNSYPSDPQWNIHNYGSNSSVRIILNNPVAASHPIHLHGHNMFVLASGPGSWDGTTIVNPANPQRRDVQLLPANRYMVIQFTADNPGAWPLHCHIAWLVSAGLYVTVLERPADIEGLRIPSIMAQTCRDWSAWTNGTVVDQIDSGL